METSSEIFSDNPHWPGEEDSGPGGSESTGKMPPQSTGPDWSWSSGGLQEETVGCSGGVEDGQGEDGKLPLPDPGTPPS